MVIDESGAAAKLTCKSMQPIYARPIVSDVAGQIAVLIQELLALEQELTTALMGRAPQAAANALPTAETLLNLKQVIDRVRPLLWIHLNRAAGKRDPASDRQGATRSPVAAG